MKTLIFIISIVVIAAMFVKPIDTEATSSHTEKRIERKRKGLFNFSSGKKLKKIRKKGLFSFVSGKKLRKTSTWKKTLDTDAWLKHTKNHTLIPKVKEKYGAEIKAASQKFGIDEDIIVAIIIIESSGDPKDKGDGGKTRGLMGVHVLHAKAKNINPKKLYEPEINIMLGTGYIKELYDRFNDMDKAIVGYNTKLKSLEKIKNYKKNDYWQKVMTLANYSA